VTLRLHAVLRRTLFPLVPVVAALAVGALAGCAPGASTPSGGRPPPRLAPPGGPARPGGDGARRRR
jgi:hypothetical protein